MLEIDTVLIFTFTEILVLTDTVLSEDWMLDILFVNAFPWGNFGVGCFEGDLASESVPSCSGPSQETLLGNSEN